eukprot:gene8002-8861_t
MEVKTENDVQELVQEDDEKPEIEEDAQSVEMELAEEAIDKSGVIKITNISPGVKVDQMKILFGFLGNIEEMALYPMDENVPVNSKTCFVKYEDKASCDVAQHLTNTVFVDRPLVVVPISDGVIPDEGTAMQPKTQPANGGFGDGDLYDPFSSDPLSQFMGSMSVGNNLPPPPVLGNIDPVKIEEIRRTIFVGNLDDSVGPEMLVAFFSGVGEIKYVRQAQNENGQKFSLIEFTDLSVIATALQYHGVIFCGKPLRVTYSKCAIIKPDFEKIEAERKMADRHSRYTYKEASHPLVPAKDLADPGQDLVQDRHFRNLADEGRDPRLIQDGGEDRDPRLIQDGGEGQDPIRVHVDEEEGQEADPNQGIVGVADHIQDHHLVAVHILVLVEPVEAAEKAKSRSRSPDRARGKKERSKSRSPNRSHSRRKSKKDRQSRSRSRSPDRKARDKDRKRDRRDTSRERSSSKRDKVKSADKEESPPQYKDVDDVEGNNSDMSIEEDRKK